MDKQEFSDRLQGLENVVGKIMDIVQAAAPVASLVPGGASVVAAVENVGNTIDAVIDAVQGESGVNPAESAAEFIAASTGNPALDARLAQIEFFIHAIAPIIKYVAHQHGMEAPEAPVTIFTTGE